MFDFLAQVPPEVFEAIGMAGFGLYVLNYVMLTFQRQRCDQISYFVINLLAAGMVLIGLFNAFNLASALIQIFWIAISTAGIVIRCRKDRQADVTFETGRSA